MADLILFSILAPAAFGGAPATESPAFNAPLASRLVTCSQLVPPAQAGAFLKAAVTASNAQFVEEALPAAQAAWQNAKLRAHNNPAAQAALAQSREQTRQGCILPPP